MLVMATKKGFGQKCFGAIIFSFAQKCFYHFIDDISMFVVLVRIE